MNMGWIERSLDHVGHTQTGSTPSTSDKENFGDFIPFIKPADFNDDGSINYSNDGLSAIGLQKSRLVKAESVLMVCIGATIGKCGWCDRDVTTNQQINVLTPVDGVSHKFLYYQMLTDNFQNQVILNSSQATLPIISKSKWRFLKVFIPPTLGEQQRIVSILDEAFEGIATAKANAEKNLQNARALFESHLQAAYSRRGEGWDEKSVREVAKHSLGKMLDKAKNKGVPQSYLRNINVRWFDFDLSDLLEMRFLPAEDTKYTAIKGDVLICEGGYPGRAAIWNEDSPIYFQKALHRVRFHELEYNKWFVYFLYLQDRNGELKTHFTGTGIQHFTGEALGRFRFPIPPLAELRQLICGFEALETETQRLESIYRQKLTALDALKKSLLDQAFTGKL